MFSAEIQSVVQSVEKFEFFNYVKKNANIKGLEEEFDQLKGDLLTLKAVYDIYEECLCKDREDHYDIKQLEEGINQKFDTFYEDTQKEAEEIFSNLEYESEDRIQTFKNTVEVLQANKQKYSFMKDDWRMEKYTKILKKSIQDNFVKTRIECVNTLQ